MSDPAAARVMYAPGSYAAADPAWDYLAAQVRGRLTPIDDDEGQLNVLRRVAHVLERDNEKPWTLEQAPPGKVQQLLPRIRSFRISIERIEGVTKLRCTRRLIGC